MSKEQNVHSGYIQPALQQAHCYGHVPLKHGSLFSGIGGFDLAAEWMGWENLFQCEKDEWCRKVLAKNFPYTNRYTDIKEFKAIEYYGKVDIVSGGFPCQPFSVAGKRKGKDDDRYLWEEMLRVIATIKPTYVVGENVTGIIGLALDTVLSDLEVQNYTTETFIIPACSKNAWHRRDRVWIVAYANSIGRQDEQKENEKSLPKGNGNDKAKEQSRGQQQCGAGKSSAILSNSKHYGLFAKQKYSSYGENVSRSQKGQKISEQFERICEPCNVANSNDTGCKEQRQPITDGTKFFAPQCSSWWEAEPGLGRVVNGLPNRVDRLKGLGNAIVPQVAFEIFKAVESVHRHCP
jgi:DNA (cytosine-5)-methyltransferase 1